jgi:hypothetical protein
MSKNPLMSVLLCALFIVLAGCGGKEEPQAPVTPERTTEPLPPPSGVTAGTINLGKAIDSDKRIAAPTETFAKGDTIYATVDTTGAGAATLKAKWTYRKGGQITVVSEDSQTVSPTGPATTEFHVSKPDGWPAGDYQVELFLDDKPLGSKNFTVK